MKVICGIIIVAIVVPAIAVSQKVVTGKLPFEDSTLQNGESFTVMPYNRLIRSAGKVITYGDPYLENHALDVSTLPDKKDIVIEDRYGIAVLAVKTNSIVAKWNFAQEKQWESLISTYSGITSFNFKNKTFIAWGASQSFSDTSAIMIAEWDGEKITAVTGINIESSGPGAKALPNQVITNTENGVLYLYAVLNGNDQLVKINFDDKKIVYSVPTGVAPYGLCIINNKAYTTNWAGPLVTDTTLENAGTPWGSAYTDPRTGATKQGSLSIIDITNGKLSNELELGLHPNAIIKSSDDQFLYIANGKQRLCKRSGCKKRDSC